MSGYVQLWIPQKSAGGLGCMKWYPMFSASGITDGAFPTHSAQQQGTPFPIAWGLQSLPACSCSLLSVTFRSCPDTSGDKVPPQGSPLAWCGAACREHRMGGKSSAEQRRSEHYISRLSRVRCLQTEYGLGTRLAQAHSVSVLYPAAPAPLAEMSPLHMCLPYTGPSHVMGPHSLPPLSLYQAVQLWCQEKLISPWGYNQVCGG